MKEIDILQQAIRNPKPGKRVSIVRMQMVKEGSFIYRPREFKNPNDVVEMMHHYFDTSDREIVGVLSLDGHSRPIAFEIIAIGTVNSCMLCPRDIFKHALLSNAVNLILLHNHPSGVPTASKEDVLVTKRIKEVGKLMGIELLDHIIIGADKEFTSLKEQGIV